MSTHLIYRIDELDDIIPSLYAMLESARICALVGTLGAGKTTLAQALLRHAGVQDVVQSPTFSYVSEYTDVNERHWYHFDLYRIDSEEAFRTMGFIEYLDDPSGFSLIEWPEPIMPILKARKALLCDIRYHSSETRELFVRLL